MALSPVYENTNTLKKLTVGGATYFLKDADLRKLVESFGTVVYKDVVTTFNEDGADIATEAAIQNMSDKFYKVKTLPVNIRFWKAWRKYGIPNDEAEDILEDHIDDFYFKHIGNANDIDEVVKFIEEMDY